MRPLLNSIRFQFFVMLALLVLVLAAAVYGGLQASNRLREQQASLDATAQLRATTYLLASLAQRLADAETEQVQTGLITSLEDTIANFDRVRVGLRNGDVALELYAISDPQILSVLDNVDRSWADYRSLLETFITTIPTDRPGLDERVNSQATIVFTFADRLARAVAFSSEQQTRTFSQISAALLVLGVLTAFLAVYVTQRAIRSIQGLQRVAAEFATGQTFSRANTRTLTEISDVGQVFNDMATRVEQLIGSLQERLVEVEHARHQAEQANQVKSAFLAAMSHELRTPLNAVINFTKFVAKGDLGPVNAEQEDTLYEVVDSAKHLLNLINDVLDMSKIESGTLNLFVTNNVDLQAIIRQVVTTGQSLLEGKGVEIHANVPDDLPRIRGDRQRIIQIMLNLMSNACKFTEEGVITVSASQVANQVIISVSDTGAGIAPEDYAGVFEAFKQTTSGLRKGGGTGLGMPITKNLVEAHGGRILLESQVGKGATFTITLPVLSETLVPTLA